MKKTMTHRGITGTIEPQEEGGFGGELLNIHGAAYYDADSLSALESKFRESVDEYIGYCHENGLNPDALAAPDTAPLKRRAG